MGVHGAFAGNFYEGEFGAVLFGSLGGNGFFRGNGSGIGEGEQQDDSEQVILHAKVLLRNDAAFPITHLNYNPTTLLDARRPVGLPEMSGERDFLQGLKLFVVGPYRGGSPGLLKKYRAWLKPGT